MSGEWITQNQREQADINWGEQHQRTGARMRGRVFKKPLELEDEQPEGDNQRWNRGRPVRGAYGAEEDEEEGRRTGEKGERLENRIAALEKVGATYERDRAYERAKAGLDTELRRLQSGVSAFEHPGLFSHIDKWVTMHEAPETHRKSMCVAGATSDVLKVPHIKLAYLGDAIWEFTRRKCAEGGEHLTKQ
jgi:hypothetical protein